MAEYVYQIVRYNEGLDHCFQYGTIHRTREGAEKFIKEVMGYKEIRTKRDGEVETLYMESGQFTPGEMYDSMYVSYKPHAYIKKHRLMD